jgi:hypothetical protein
MSHYIVKITKKIHILCHIFVRHVNKKNPRLFFLMLYSTFEVRQNLHEVKLFTVAKIHMHGVGVE